jgi:hypothetical protein
LGSKIHDLGTKLQAEKHFSAIQILIKIFGVIEILPVFIDFWQKVTQKVDIF